jgi:predicted TIM-barrel fold metal-dependent hydrolase
VTVDSHVHLLPPRLGAAIRAFFAEHGASPDTWCYPLDHDEVCASLAGAGVTEAWSLPYARRAGTAVGLNEASAATATAQAAGPVRIVGGATVHPADKDPAGVVRTAVEDLGLRVLKLHCSVGDFSPDDARLDPVWEYISRVRLPAVVHAGHARTGHTRAEELAPIATVAARWPEARVIIAHSGHHAVGTAFDLLDAHPNLHVDLTPVVHDPVPLQARRVAAVAERVLFGSDCPNTAVPVGAALAAVDALDVAPEARLGIRGANARRLQAEILV